MLQALGEEVDHALVAAHGNMDADRRSRVSQTMGALMRPHGEAVPRSIVDEIAFDEDATVKPAEQKRIERGGSLAVMDDPALQRAYDGLAKAINAELRGILCWRQRNSKVGHLRCGRQEGAQDCRLTILYQEVPHHGGRCHLCDDICRASRHLISWPSSMGPLRMLSDGIVDHGC